MRHAGKDGEIPAMLLQRLQIAREFVILAGLLREEERRMVAERTADEEHAFGAHGRGLLLRPQADGQHGVEQRQTDADAGGVEEGASIKREAWHARNPQVQLESS